MTEVWKSGDKERLQQSINRNRPSFPAMMFMGIMDVMMFSSMMSFMGPAMSIFMPDISMYNSPLQTQEMMEATRDMMWEEVTWVIRILATTLAVLTSTFEQGLNYRFKRD